VGDAERVAAGALHEAAFERLARGKGDRVDHDIELTPLAFQSVSGGRITERRVDLIVHRDVEWHAS
jgi:hypothetical protein